MRPAAARSETVHDRNVQFGAELVGVRGTGRWSRERTGRVDLPREGEVLRSRCPRWTLAEQVDIYCCTTADGLVCCDLGEDGLLLRRRGEAQPDLRCRLGGDDVGAPATIVTAAPVREV